MAGEIFISYRRADRAWAELLHGQLRAEGVEAWYDAHVGAGEDWRTATATALKTSRIFVLLFSANAAQSGDIAKELAAAVFEKKMIIPVRLEDIAPDGAFLYELASRNWVNAYDHTETKLLELAKALAHLVKTGTRDENVLPFDRSDDGQIPAQQKRRRKRAIIAVAAAVMAAAVAALFWLYPRPAAVVADSQSRPAGVSIAVLPFLNLSSDKDQEFFSDGITEEIPSALAKVPGLTVIGRTSAFQFKGQNKDLRAIGQALGVKNLIEGSVRKDGNQVRITAQLIRVDDGTHLWTESYDRDLKGIFVIQEEIALAITDAMKVPLGLRHGEKLVSNRTDDLDAYQQYLEARALFRARKIDDAIAALKRVVTRDPSYAPAWALLSAASTLPNQFVPIENKLRAGSIEEARQLAQSLYDGAEKAAREAIRLDPRLAIGYAALAPIESRHRHWIAAEDEFRHALALDPNDPDILYAYAAFLAAVGHLQDARRLQIQILALEPFVPNYRRQAADVLWAMGQNTAAEKMLEPMSSNQESRLILAKVYATVGRYAAAADTLLDFSLEAYPRQTLDDAARLIRSAPASVGASDAALPFAGGLVFVYLFTGAKERLLEPAELQLQINMSGNLFRDPWAPPSASLRKTERFKTFVRKTGFVDYWRARGWPDACHPVGQSDFACN